MSACNTFTEHVWKPGECKNCFKPKSQHHLAEGGLKKTGLEVPSQEQNHPPTGTRSNTNSSQRGGGAGSSASARSSHFRPPVAKKPTIAVKPTMMLSCSSAGLDMEGNLQRPPDAGEPGKTSDFAVWTRNGMNRKRPGGPNNNEGEDAGDEIEGYGQGSRRTPTGNDNGLTDVLKEIAGLGSCLNPSPLSGSKDLFLGRISSSFQRSLERGLPASGCLAMGSSSGGATQKRVSVSNSMEVISTEGGRFCYPEFSSEGEDDDEDEEHEEDESDGNDDSEHESWDESDEELLAMEIRMRGQPRFANFRAATLSPVPFAQGKKWNTVPLRNRSLQRICAVDYDDSYDEILNGYPSIDSNGGHGHLPYGPADLQGSGFLSNSECTTSPESSSSLPEDSRTTSSCSSSAHCGPLKNGLHSPSAFRPPVLQAASKVKEQQTQKDLNPPKAIETHKAVLAIRLEDQDGRECLPMPQALPGQPVTISFSPTEEQAKPYRVVNLEKPLICKPYTVVDVSASMASPEEHNQERTPKPKTPVSPLSFPISPLGQPLSPASPMSPSSSISHLSITPSAVQGNACKKLGAIRYQEVWTSSTSPRQKMAKVDLGSSTASGPPVPPRYCSHKSAPTSPIAGLSSSRTVPVKSPNLSEIKFNSYNNAGMPPFPIIIRDDTTYFRSSKNAVKVPIVINPSAYDNLAVYKSFLGLSGELSQPKEGRVASHTYEEIGSSESVQPSPTEQTSVCKVASEKAAVDEKKAAAAALISKELTTRTTIDSVTAVSTASGAVSPATAVQSPLTVAAILSKSSPGSATSARVRKISGDTTSSREGSADYPPSSCTGTGHRENASTVLSQIVASIQPPQSCPESPYPSSKAYGIDELHALPLDATKEMLNRPKSLFSSTDGCLSKPRKDTPSKQLPKSQSASAAVPLSSPTKSEPNAPFPPPRSTSSPYHASNILQRHFGNWTKPSIASSPTRPSDGETSPGGGEGRRVAESAKPKRWISFKSFFRRRKDDDEQRDKAEKEKGKLVGLDGTVIHMLPPPPIQRHHWFSEAKNEDPNQKPTIIFTYKPDSSASGDGKGELRVEECKETVLLSPEVSRDVRPLSPGRTPSPQMGTAFHCKTISQVPGDANISEGETPTVTSLPGKLARLPPRDEIASLAVTPASVSEGSASLDDPEEEDGHSHSPTSSSCSATYSNLGQSRANMIPLKHPRNMKSSDDALADLEEEATKATPPPLPKKSVARAVFETSSLGKELPIRPKHEAKPGGTNLSVANPVYDLDSTWETGSHSSSISSEARVHDQESGDSLERPVAVVNKGRGANSLSCLMSAPSATTGRERRGCRSAESLAGRARTTGRGGGGNSKQQRQALYKGMDSWEEVVGRIRGLHTDTLRKLAGKCEDRFMAGQKDHLRFGTDSWSHFRLTTGKPCCEAGDAVYYTASYAKDPLVNYAIKICRSKVKETQQQFFHSLAVRQSLALHFNIQQDCGHFLADVPARLLPWEEEEEEKEGNEEKEDEDGQKGKEDKEISTKKDKKEVVETTNVMQNGQAEDSRCPGNPAGASGHLSSRVVVITREVPFQTVADFVRDGASRHARNPDLYERQVCLLLLQLCSGLEHMKPYHVTHCDLRLENLLLVHCQPGNPWNLDLLEPNNNSSNSASSGAGAANAAANATCPARLIISNFSQAKQKNPLVEDPGALRDQSRLAPEIVTATQYRKCDEFQTGILIYEMLHRPNPFEETPELKEREYTWADLPPLPARSLYSQGLQQLASLLLTVNPSERIQMAEARACLQCLLWGPREDLFQALSCTSGPIPGAITSQRETTLQNWLDLKRTLMMIKFAERSLDTGCGVSLEDWLCCQYLAFATTDTLSRVVRILQQQNPRTQHTAQSQNLAQSQNVFKSLHLSQSQQHITHTEHITHSQPL